jgi:hypothetical protein
MSPRADFTRRGILGLLHVPPGYFHRTLRSAEAVLRSIFRRVLQLFENGVDVWVAPGTAFEKIVRHKSLSLAEHLRWTTQM